MKTRRRITAGPIPRLSKPTSEEAPGPAVEGSLVRRILCPIDFSEFSLAAAGEAVALARLWKAQLTTLFVFPPAAASGEDPSERLAPIPDTSVRSVVAKDMQDFLLPAGAADLPVRHSFKAGDPARSILDEAAALPADLLVMGTHGRSGLERWVLGSVTDRVLRQAPCPVLTVSRPAAGTPVSAPLTGILCAVDLTETSEMTLGYALALAQKADVPLTVVHVVEGITEASAPVPYGVSQHGLHRETEARDCLRRAVPSAAGSRVEEVVVTGRPYREILRLAVERGTGLIVVGTHGPDPIDRMFFGSTADHVVRGAPCPVLTVRPSPTQS